MCVFDMCALYVPIVILFTASCMFGHSFNTVVIYLNSCWVQLLIILRLLYMNQYHGHDQWNYVGYYTRNGHPFNKTLNTADWLGFHQSKHGVDYADFSQVLLCFLYLGMATLTRVVAIWMKNFRISRNIPLNQTRVLFPDITYLNCHDNTGNMLKFFANYGFYRFGCEVCAVVACIIMLIRMDIVAVGLSFWLLLIFSLRRSLLRIVWLPTIVLAASGLVLQYLATLGWWPSYWNHSLTRYWSSTDFLLRIQQFCHFPNMAHPPIKEKLSLDYLLLLLLCRQWRAFQREWKIKSRYSVAGRNIHVFDLFEDPENENPVPDFMTYTR
uniref:Piezo domain-containing protein n=1 Tax=Dendroctonus ponderosae TaxID=77166 RepID=A0AAR5PH95_DENPD